MVARIIELAVYRAQRTLANREVAEKAALAKERASFHFWAGASGKRYVHHIYSLRECPALPAANYVLVRRHEDGRAEALAIGRVTHEADTLNLAEIRQRGAELAADEVHVHLLAPSNKISKLIEFDLRTAQAQTELNVASAGSNRLH
ncbi:hypothetical protein [Hyphomicrobium sulfonivorans]|uniref:hypothetical protein n=1 Tax=Hyphomicrobium sulfonivorans TaxID=121290 RepID=UPI00156DA4D9|nr:hypothetical protein [Hyphomicrobium sulfonivorans]MBI1649435.1 hypothetical protein [Hyphomicrobium sulfonivorans]NSL71352.1 hypothetical protein [Hyphomicrobium sulfonivorans]